MPLVLFKNRLVYGPLGADPYANNVLYLFRLNDNYDAVTATGGSSSFTGPGGSFTTNRKFGSAALYLNGSSYKSIYNPNANMDGDFTLDFWYNFNSANNNVILATPDAYNGANATTIGVYAQQVVLGNAFCYNTSNYYASTVNTWHYFVITRSNNVMRFYSNGGQVGSAITKSGNLNLTTLWLNGGPTGWGRGTNGLYDSIRLTKGVVRSPTPPTIEY